MKKRFFSVLLVMILLTGMMIGLTACGDKDEEEDDNNEKYSVSSSLKQEEKIEDTIQKYYQYYNELETKKLMGLFKINSDYIKISEEDYEFLGVTGYEIDFTDLDYIEEVFTYYFDKMKEADSGFNLEIDEISKIEATEELIKSIGEATENDYSSKSSKTTKEMENSFKKLEENGIFFYKVSFETNGNSSSSQGCDVIVIDENGNVQISVLEMGLAYFYYSFQN